MVSMWCSQVYLQVSFAQFSSLVKMYVWITNFNWNKQVLICIRNIEPYQILWFRYETLVSNMPKCYMLVSRCHQSNESMIYTCKSSWIHKYLPECVCIPIWQQTWLPCLWIYVIPQKKGRDFVGYELIRNDQPKTVSKKQC